MKRFTDTELSDKEWFMSLSCRLKCVVRYLFDKCDSAGVWTPNYKLASIYVGEPFTEQEVLEIDDGDQFEKFGEKILVRGFLDFQYGELSEKCNPHKPVIKKLIKYGLWENGNLRVPERVSNTLKEEEKDKDKEEDKEKEKDKKEIFIVPEMQKIWKKEKPDYPDDILKDYTAIRSISQFICNQSNIKFPVKNKEDTDTILGLWRTISQFISDHKFFKNYSLYQVEKHIQSITQEIKNEKSNNKNGKPGGGKVDSEQVNSAFTQFYTPQQPAGYN